MREHRLLPRTTSSLKLKLLDLHQDLMGSSLAHPSLKNEADFSWKGGGSALSVTIYQWLGSSPSSWNKWRFLFKWLGEIIITQQERVLKRQNVTKWIRPTSICMEPQQLIQDQSLENKLLFLFSIFAGLFVQDWEHNKLMRPDSLQWNEWRR